MFRNYLKLLVGLFAVTWLLTGCAGVAISGSTYAIKNGQRADLEPLALAGDVDAQYELGKSYCCMGPGFDTQTATRWLCASAKSGHVLAQYELGRIYAGDISRTPAPGQKLMRMAKARKSLPHAYYWFSVAADQGLSKAGDEAANLVAAVGADDFEGEPEYCEYNDVFAI